MRWPYCSRKAQAAGAHTGRVPFAWDRPPRVIGHRGAPTHAPENTLASFDAAVRAGARAIELDVRMTQDGHLVVAHDAACGRTIAGDGFVEDMTLAALHERDAGAWFGARFVGERVPTLDAVLAALPADTLFDVEIKADARNADRVPSKLHAQLAAAGALDRALITSFDPELASEYARISQRPAGAIMAFEPEDDDFDSWRDLRFVAIVRDVAKGGALETLLARKKRVLVWTVNDAAEAARFLERGASGIITDKPDELAALATTA